MTETQRDAVAAAIAAEFAGEVESEEVAQPGRYRFAVCSPAFEAMPQLTRQDRLWEIVDRVLPREDTLDVSIILAFAPSEMQPHQ